MTSSATSSNTQKPRCETSNDQQLETTCGDALTTGTKPTEKAYEAKWSSAFEDCGIRIVIPRGKIPSVGDEARSTDGHLCRVTSVHPVSDFYVINGRILEVAKWLRNMGAGSSKRTTTWMLADNVKLTGASAPKLEEI